LFFLVIAFTLFRRQLLISIRDAPDVQQVKLRQFLQVAGTMGVVMCCIIITGLAFFLLIAIDQRHAMHFTWIVFPLIFIFFGIRMLRNVYKSVSRSWSGLQALMKDSEDENPVENDANEAAEMVPVRPKKKRARGNSKTKRLQVLSAVTERSHESGNHSRTSQISLMFFNNNTSARQLSAMDISEEPPSSTVVTPKF
jgi:Sec-independent protein translocase protein TatA